MHYKAYYLKNCLQSLPQAMHNMNLRGFGKDAHKGDYKYDADDDDDDDDRSVQMAITCSFSNSS